MAITSRTLIKQTIEETKLTKRIQAWRRKGSLTQAEARKELLSLLDKKYPNWNILVGPSSQYNMPILRGNQKQRTDEQSQEKKDDTQLFNKEDMIYKFAKSKNNWIKSYGEIKLFKFTLYSDQTKAKVIMGPFSVDSESKINKIQILKEKYCLSLLFNLPNNRDTGQFNLQVGFDTMQQAMEWQDILEKIGNINKVKMPASKALSKSPIRNRMSPLNKQLQPNLMNFNAAKQKDKTDFRQDFFNKAKEYQAILEESKSDQDIANTEEKQQDQSPHRVQAQEEANNLLNQRLSLGATPPQKGLNELSFGHEQKMLFNNSNTNNNSLQDSMQFGKSGSNVHQMENDSLANPLKQSLDLGNVTAAFGDKQQTGVNRGRQTFSSQQKFERTLSPLSEENFSDDEEVKNATKKKESTKNLFIELAEKQQTKIIKQDQQQQPSSNLLLFDTYPIENKPIQQEENKTPVVTKSKDKNLMAYEKKQSTLSDIATPTKGADLKKTNTITNERQSQFTSIPGQSSRLTNLAKQKKKVTRHSKLTSELKAKEKIQEILKTKPPEELLLEEFPTVKIKHTFIEDIQSLIQFKEQSFIEAAPYQFQPIMSMFYSKESKQLLKIKEDQDQLIYNKNNLRVYSSEDFQTLIELAPEIDKYLKDYINEQSCFILKSFFLIDSPMASVRRLFDEPERLRLWDPSVHSTRILNNLQSNNSKVYLKLVKPCLNPKGPLQSQLLLNYSSEINNSLYFMIEQSIENHQYSTAKEKSHNRIILPLNLIIAKQKSGNRTEIKQYLCISPNQHAGLFTRCGIVGNERGLILNGLMKQLKQHYEGLKNYAQTITKEQKHETVSNADLLSRSRSQSNDRQQQKNDRMKSDPNKFQENQVLLSEILSTKHQSKKSHYEFDKKKELILDHIEDDRNQTQEQPKQAPLKSERFNQEKKFLEDEMMFKAYQFSDRKTHRNTMPKSANQIDNILQDLHLQSPLRDNARDLDRVRTPSQQSRSYSQTSRGGGPSQHYRGEYPSPSRLNLGNDEPRGIDHYRKSGILSRNFDNQLINRKPSPVTDRRKEQFRRSFIKKQTKNSRTRETRMSSPDVVTMVKEEQNSILQLLDQSSDEKERAAKSQVITHNKNQQFTIQKVPEVKVNNIIKPGDQNIIEKRAHTFNNQMNQQLLQQPQRLITIGTSEQLQQLLDANADANSNDNDYDDEVCETSEDSDYDFEEEVKDVELCRRRKNTFFEDHDFRKDPKHGLLYLNQEILKKQRGVLGHFIKQMGSNVVQGKSVLQISLPIKVFDAKSFLEKCAMFFKMAPIYFEKAAAVPQISFEKALERFKYIVAFGVSIRHYTAQMRKPFNPILGETYQARVGQYKLCLEQISHHPPITYFSMWSKYSTKFKAYGSLEYRPVMGANSAGGHGYGPFIVEFEDGHKIELWSPVTEITGMMYGERAFNIYDIMTFKDKQNGIYCEIQFNPERKTGISSLFNLGKSQEISENNLLHDRLRADYIEGVISKNPKIDFKRNRKNIMQSDDVLCFVNGHWTEDLYIDGVQYWHIDDHKGFNIRPTKDPLPSDCRFREDLVYLLNGDEDTAQKWKEILENKQRHDRKLRDECEKKRRRASRAMKY